MNWRKHNFLYSHTKIPQRRSFGDPDAKEATDRQRRPQQKPHGGLLPDHLHRARRIRGEAPRGQPPDNLSQKIKRKKRGKKKETNGVLRENERSGEGVYGFPMDMGVFEDTRYIMTLIALASFVVMPPGGEFHNTRSRRSRQKEKKKNKRNKKTCS